MCAVEKAMSVHNARLARRDPGIVFPVSAVLDVMAVDLDSKVSPFGELAKIIRDSGPPSHLVQRTFPNTC